MQPQSYKSQTDIYHSVHIGAVMLVLRWSCYYLQDIFLDMKQRLGREWEREREGGLLISIGWKPHKGISIYIIYCPFFINHTRFFLIFYLPLDFFNLVLRRSLYIKPSSASEWIKISLTKYYVQWTTNCTASHIIICVKSYYVNIMAYISLNRMT